MHADAYSDFKNSLLNQASSLRSRIRSGAHTSTTSGMAHSLVQGNVVILPADWASDFLLYCQNNPVACPLIAVSEPGDPTLPDLGRDLDIRTDIPEYQVFRNGERTETLSDIQALWQDDFVTFVLGCSFSFEDALIRAGLSVRNVDDGLNVSMYRSNIATRPAGRFRGNMVVSMRPFPSADAIRAIQVTTRLPKAHGAPVHIGDPALIGIEDIGNPDFGDPVTIKDHELPLFWACGVTPQLALENARPPIAITHVPGKMLLTERLNEELAVL
ncbi:putative hydro-lyase [Marinobacter sp. F4206]|uniref:putative hydro-lyase n=1 Tax=Marinobacter sp. F4206 TaxID=2861777 RepID=UPI001C5E3E33|nr:putative hydro-lyase [Marinobacter sp. F4206]MBW4934056.1 putative hydro-lyase [Marinobacter sp. F4206]